MTVEIVIDHESPSNLKPLLNRNGPLMRVAVKPGADPIPWKPGPCVLRLLPTPVVLHRQEVFNARLNKVIVARSRNRQESHQRPGGLGSGAVSHSAQRI